MITTSDDASGHSRARVAGLLAAGLLPWLAGSAQAVELSLADDQIKGALDTTVSYEQMWRVQGQDKRNDDVNTNDGNRNFDTGLVSEVFKLTSELELSYMNYGLFIRGSAFYDTQIMDKRNNFDDHYLPAQPSQNAPKNSSFTRATRDSAGHDVEILDAYVRGNWDVAGAPLDARLGRQVFNWGEGLFYRGGVNTTNPINAASFRLPGSELKEVLVPVEALSFNVGLTDALSVETFYQFNWKETQVDPVGTYFSETDLFAAGGNTAYAPVPALAPVTGLYQGLSAAGVGGLQGAGRVDKAGNLKAASIGPDINARNDGQYGIAMRYMAEELNSTEFGLYFVNYHAKETTINADLG
ncbi:MAG: glycine/betaine transmethylase, partial [Pseudomonas sp.]|nr:glycine/betaine transmethylase [Pseudomonas sp.]